MARWAAIAWVLVAGAFAAPGAPSQAASSDPSFSTDPGLTPGFRSGVHDYAIRCDGGRVKISVHIPEGWLGRIGSGGFKRADFVARRPLTPGKAFMVTFRRANQPRRYNFHARCLPPDFPAYDFTRTGPGGPEYFIVQMNNNYAAIFDRHGVPVWWYKAKASPINAELLPDGTLAWAPVDQQASQLLGGYEIRRLNGQLVRVVKAVDGFTDFHDLQLLPNGNYLVAGQVSGSHRDASPFGGSADATVLGFEIQEVTPEGKLVWRWSSLKHIGLNQTPTYWWDRVLGDDQPALDIQHWNSLEAEGKYVLVSFRHLDAVYEINRKTGGIRWKLGGTSTPKSLEVQGDPEGSYPLRGQHDARRLFDGTVSIHDNATGLNRPPRAVRYRIDPRARTATLVESVSDANYPASSCCGSARKLASGDWLIGWGRAEFVGGYDSHGRRIFKLNFPGGFSYRANPLPTHALSAADLRHAMNAMSR